MNPEARPLVVLTHPDPRGRALAAMLAAAGHDVLPLPAFALREVDAGGVSRAAAALHAWDWVIPVSPTAAQILLRARGGAPWPPGVQAATVGAGTASVLRESVPASCLLQPPGDLPPDADTLLAMPAFAAPHGIRVLLVRGTTGRETLAATLRARGARVDELAAYERVDTPWLAQALARLDDAARCGRPALFVFTSVDAVHRLGGALSVDAAAWAKAQPALAVHPRMTQALREQGWRDVRHLPSGPDALRAAIESGLPRTGHRA